MMGSIRWLLSAFAHSPGFEMKGCFLLSGGRPVPRVGCMQMWKTELLRGLRGGGTGRESRVLARSSVLAGQSRGRASLPLGIWGAGPSTVHVVCGTVDGGRSGPADTQIPPGEGGHRKAPEPSLEGGNGGRGPSSQAPEQRTHSSHGGGSAGVSGALVLALDKAEQSAGVRPGSSRPRGTT